MKYAFLSILFVALVFIGCEEEKDPTVVQIVAVTEDGAVVPNAVIQFNCESSFDPPRPCAVELTAEANQNGFYQREFASPSVLRINAFKIDRDTTVIGILPDTNLIITADSLCGETFVSIQEFSTTRKEIVVRECN